MYSISDVMAQVNANPALIVSLAFATYIIGFIQYGASMYMQVKNKQCPFYFWQHAWYFGHDLTFSLLFSQWFFVMDFWLFKVLCVGCMCFVGIEIFSLYRSVKFERNEIWGKFYNGNVSEKSAWLRGILGYILGFALFQLIRLAIGDVCCLVLMMSTNAMLALAAHLRAEEIGVRQKGTRFLAWFTLLGTILTFCPKGIGFFASAVVVLNAPWFFILGGICVLCALRFVVISYKLPSESKL